MYSANLLEIGYSGFVEIVKYVLEVGRSTWVAVLFSQVRNRNFAKLKKMSQQ